MKDKEPSRPRTGPLAGADADAEQREIERLKEEVRREHEMYLRSLADFDNYRRRIEREGANASRAGKREIILSLLDLLDDFERALQHIDDSPAPIAAGVRSIWRRLAALLQTQGVTPYDSVGEPFDPKLHDAAGSVETDAEEPGTVLEELNRGYRWGEEVLRPARVLVAR